MHSNKAEETRNFSESDDEVRSSINECLVAQENTSGAIFFHPNRSLFRSEVFISVS